MITLHDTILGSVPFRPHDEIRVTLWVCGPTVYDSPHLGNARSAVVFDVLFRLLRHQYGEEAVVYARNYTDIDDKIIANAANLEIGIDDLTESTISEYEDIMRELGSLPPTLTPRATQYVDQMVTMIEQLIDKGIAYEAEGHVLFSVEASQQIKSLTGEVERVAGARVAVEPYKRDPRDFVLWKPAKDGEPAYVGPLGLLGRMGWHIECSSMIGSVLGETIDIHAGGSDLIFPHHECEIMQSETLSREPLARHWLHNGMLTVDGEKMSKSLGNFVTVPDALVVAPGEAIRYLLLSGHYQQSLDWTRDKLLIAKTALDRLYRALERVWDAEPIWVDPAVLVALRDNLNTPRALAHLHEIATLAFTADQERWSELRSQLVASGALLGLLQKSPPEWFQGDAGDDAATIEEMLADREAARLSRDFVLSDHIREQLRDRGILVEDTTRGQVWRVI